MKRAFLDKLIDRLDKLDANSLQNHFLHLAREKGLLETIFNAIQEGIVVLDGKCTIRYANRAASRLLGHYGLEGAFIGRYLQEIEWDLVLALDEREWSRVVNREIEITHPEHRFVAFYIVPLSMVNRSEEGALMLLRDVTREREHEASARESERINAITLLAAGVAHEIGNPLNSMNIHLQLIERETHGLPEEYRHTFQELIDVTKCEVERLDQIIHQFLGAIRPVKLKLAKSSVPELLKETLKFMKHEIRNRNVLAEVDVEGDPPPIVMDCDQIKQVFFNIVKNALDAMPNGGLLKVVVSVDARFVSVMFRDSGEGIPLDRIRDIFEPYQTTKREGTGLGLMIVQRIIRDHGGQIEVHSQPERGTTFTVFLPLKDVRMRLLKPHREQFEADGETDGDAEAHPDIPEEKSEA